VESLVIIDPPIDLAVRVFIAATRDSSAVVRVAGAFALGRMHAERVPALPELVRLLADNDSHVRRAALLGIAEFGQSADRLEPELVRVRQSDTSKVVQEAADVALAAVRGQVRSRPHARTL
jgi:HEAT repeat protein